jgi:hypothetical protein
MSNTRFICNVISAPKPIPSVKCNTLITVKRDKKRNGISANGNIFSFTNKIVILLGFIKANDIFKGNIVKYYFKRKICIQKSSD